MVEPNTARIATSSFFSRLAVRVSLTFIATFFASSVVSAQTKTFTGEDATTVYITKSGTKYHREQCMHLRLSAIEKQLGEVKDSYGPCGTCKPDRGHAPSYSAPSTKPGAPPSNGLGSGSTPKSTAGTVQCSGMTQQGARCKRTTTNSSGRCYQH